MLLRKNVARKLNWTQIRKKILALKKLTTNKAILKVRPKNKTHKLRPENKHKEKT